MWSRLACERLYQIQLRRYPLETTRTQLKDYQGRLLNLKGVAEVPVEYKGQKYQLPLVIVAGNWPALLGRNWLERVRLNW